MTTHALCYACAGESPEAVREDLAAGERIPLCRRHRLEYRPAPPSQHRACPEARAKPGTFFDPDAHAPDAACYCPGCGDASPTGDLCAFCRCDSGAPDVRPAPSGAAGCTVVRWEGRA